jgi:PhnB protein
MQTNKKINSAFFITFSGNCKKALTLYQSCFGGDLYFNTFDELLDESKESPVVSGSLASEKITIYGSDLVPNEGRRTGNFMSIYIHCNNHNERLNYLKKLDNNLKDYSPEKYAGQKLIEITDPFEVRWIFGVL